MEPEAIKVILLESVLTAIILIASICAFNYFLKQKNRSGAEGEKEEYVEIRNKALNLLKNKCDETYDWVVANEFLNKNCRKALLNDLQVLKNSFNDSEWRNEVQKLIDRLERLAKKQVAF